MSLTYVNSPTPLILRPFLYFDHHLLLSGIVRLRHDELSAKSPITWFLSKLDGRATSAAVGCVNVTNQHLSSSFLVIFLFIRSSLLLSKFS